MKTQSTITQTRIPWNKGKIVGQKLALKLKEIWEIRIRLQMANNIRELALINKFELTYYYFLFQSRFNLSKDKEFKSGSAAPWS